MTPTQRAATIHIGIAAMTIVTVVGIITYGTVACNLEDNRTIRTIGAGGVPVHIRANCMGDPIVVIEKPEVTK